MIQDLLNQYNRLRETIRRGETLPPLLVFSGEEAFFINLFEVLLTEHYLPPEEQQEGRQIFFGPETGVDVVLSAAQTASMFAPKQIILVREAAQLKPTKGKTKNVTVEDLPDYLHTFAAGVTVALFYRGKEAGARLKKSIKAVQDKNPNACLLVESPLLRKDSEVRYAVGLIAKMHQVRLTARVPELFLDLVGADLPTINAQLTKLSVPAANNGGVVSEQMVMDLVGMSRFYKPYDLQDAVKAFNRKKAFTIAAFMAEHENEKAYALPAVIGMFYKFFGTLMVFLFNKRQPEGVLLDLMGLDKPYQLRQYQEAARYYTARKVMNIISALRTADATVKGARGGNPSYRDILTELLMSIFY